MVYPIFALILLIIVIITSFYVMIYMISLVYSLLMGSPFVKTKSRTLDRVFKEANLKPNQLIIDLGCGDGKIVRTAAKHYKLRGIGVDINPLLIYRAKIMAKLEHLSSVTFYRQNIFDADISEADVVYLFLLPRFLVKLRAKLKNETKKDVLIISHGFQIEDWSKYMIKKIEGKPFSTFYYRLHSA